MSDAGMAHLKKLSRLSALDLEGTKVTDACIGHLRELPKLYRISLRGTRMTRAAERRLRVELRRRRFSR